jgi:hypothetical protein
MADVHNQISGGAFGAVQAHTVEKIVLPAPVPIAVNGLPAAPPEFTGRAAELADLLDILCAESNPVAVTVISGVAGVGKTTLALQAAHDTRSTFPGGTLFVDLRGYDSPEAEPVDALVMFLRALGVRGEHIPDEPQARAVQYRSAIRQREPMLILIDNAGSAEQVRPLLPGLPHRVLVTSRHSLADVTGTRQLDLDVMPTPDAIALIDTALRTRRPDDHRVTDEQTAATELTALCGELPLALGIVAAILADDPGLPVAELVTTLRDTPNRLDDLRFGDTPGLAAAFGMSYARLTRDEQQLFRFLPLNPSPVFSVETVAAVAGLPEPDTRRLLASLRRAHMVESAGPRGRFRMHDLLRAYALTLIKPDAGSRSNEILTNAYSRLCAYFVGTAASASLHVAAQHADDMGARFPAWHAADAWLEASWLSRFPDHVAAIDWIRNERDGLVRVSALAELSGMAGVAPPLARLLLPYCMLWGDWDLGIDLGREALHGAERDGDWDEQLAIFVWLKNIVAFRSSEGFVRDILLPPATVDGTHPRRIDNLTAELRQVRSKRLHYDEVATLVELACAHGANQDHAAMRRWALKAANLCRELDLRLFLAHSNALAGVAAAAAGRRTAARENLRHAKEGYTEFQVDDLTDAVARRLATLDEPGTTGRAGR